MSQKKMEVQKKQLQLTENHQNRKPVNVQTKKNRMLKYSSLATGLIALAGVALLGGEFVFGQELKFETQLADRKVESAALHGDVEIGEIITFGRYEQDNDLTNGAEDIDWIVLDVDERNHRALLLSVKGLDVKPYNQKNEDITWADCTLRSWLNGTGDESFYGGAFTDEEKATIVETKVINKNNPIYKTNGGSDTFDNIFLLSIDEVANYFDSDESLRCQPSEYAISQGARVSEDFSPWWLRSPGYKSYLVALVNADGYYLGGTFEYVNSVCVRPALWVDLGNHESETTDSEVETEDTTTTEIQEVVTYAELQVGDTITFGKYEQDNDTSNGAEAIEWIVLDVDEENHQALILSVKGLVAKQYDTFKLSTTWADCTLRSWLNGAYSDSFYWVAFTGEERARIIETEVTNAYNLTYNTNGGPDTSDYIFLLSIEEAANYFDSDESRICVPTAYAIAQGAFQSGIYTVGGEGTCAWWLRSPGLNGFFAAYMLCDGSVNEFGSYVDFGEACVRPALWVDLTNR